MRNLIFVSSLLIACAGEAPLGPRPDAAPPPADAPPPAETGQRVSGKVRDYFLPNTFLAMTTVTTDGITPAKSATSGNDGAYALPPVAPNSKMFLEATRTGY